MSPKLRLLGILFLIAALFGLSSLYTVDEGHAAIKLLLGRPVKNGNVVEVYEPGIHFKWPFVNTVKIFDMRLQTLAVESPPVAINNQSKVLVNYYVKWKIDQGGDGILRYFTSTQGSNAGDLLASNINNDLKTEFGKKNINEVISERDQTTQAIKSKIIPDAKENFGMDVVDIRIKAIDLPPNVYGSVFERMRSQRAQEATALRSQGKQEAEQMRALADAQVTILLAQAKQQAAEMRANGKDCSHGVRENSDCVNGGEKNAANVYAAAYKADPEFYRFYRSLEAYKKDFSSKQDMIVVQPDSDFFKYFNNASGAAGSKS